jgi:hypothetical protein
MNIPTSMGRAFYPVIVLALSASALHAQIVTGNGYIDLSGGPSPWAASGSLSGQRLVWSPANNALRIGEFTGQAEAWAVQSYVLGSGSAGAHALTFLGNAGSKSIALGQGSSSGGGVAGGVAIGTSSSAPSGGIALGRSATASGGDSIAIGPGALASGYQTVAIRGSAQGASSFAFGTIVNGVSSVGLGSGGMGSGIYANNAFTFAGSVYANEAVALGFGTFTNSLRSVALGRGNVSKRQDGSTPDPVVANLRDPILMVGNWDSTPGATQKNALTVYRNNDAHLNGVLRVRPGGDVSMGSFTAVPAGVVFP